MSGPGIRPTSVRLIPQAAKALDALSARQRSSRESVIRDLLDSYISAQRSLEQGDRLTHVTAALKYPPLPPGRNLPDGRVRVPARLEVDTVETVASLTLRLPGQSRRRGLKHYARSPLAEALTTAIALEQAFEVPGIEDLPAIWTQAAAIALWRLTVAATLTKPEQQAVLGDLEDLDADAEDPADLARILRQGELAWHHPWRYEVALQLARNLLTGSRAAEGWELLCRGGQPFDDLRFDLERTDDLDHRLLRGAPRGAGTNVTGRGGSLVWRARRSLALAGVRNWIVEQAPTPLVVSPPRAKIVHPPGWTSIRVASGEDLPGEVVDDLRAGRVLEFSTDQDTAAWPYLRETGRLVPRFDIVIEELPRRLPEEVAELVLLDDPRLRSVYLHPDVAFDLGFIDAAVRDDLISDAAAKTAARMTAILQRAETWTSRERSTLRALRDEPERFFAYAARHRHVRDGVVRPWWEWQAESTLTALDTLAEAPERLRHLVRSRGRSWKRQLELAMEGAGRAAIAGLHSERDDLLEVEPEWGEGVDVMDIEFDLGDLLD